MLKFKCWLLITFCSPIDAATPQQFQLNSPLANRSLHLAEDRIKPRPCMANFKDRWTEIDEISREAWPFVGEPSWSPSFNKVAFVRKNIKGQGFFDIVTFDKPGLGYKSHRWIPIASILPTTYGDLRNVKVREISFATDHDLVITIESDSKEFSPELGYRKQSVVYFHEGDEKSSPAFQVLSSIGSISSELTLAKGLHLISAVSSDDRPNEKRDYLVRTSNHDLEVLDLGRQSSTATAWLEAYNQGRILSDSRNGEYGAEFGSLSEGMITSFSIPSKRPLQVIRSANRLQINGGNSPSRMMLGNGFTRDDVVFTEPYAPRRIADGILFFARRSSEEVGSWYFQSKNDHVELLWKVQTYFVTSVDGHYFMVYYFEESKSHVNQFDLKVLVFDLSAI